ncbi:DUF1045 domain-containing protein [Sulfitobacter sp. F26169L]|uniref:DUF1045 domain-containing protein n=1 Tax=Sulfitobacter sp. F26169L TaxID=2996015 RepID=UPI002260B066|nr:DUF1045 domain-containing protein [Sulfitobacter sp. F26169L]MCX7567265.1 DUF1045 domain-containing protein [Sulfitobacter sp. F26169L]
MMFRRFAIYITPDGKFGAQGAAWLGWDILAGEPVAQPQSIGIDLAKITRRPRKYGFHGTVKPPMALGCGYTPDMLEAEARAVASRLSPIILNSLEVCIMGRMLAFVPSGDSAALADLAATVVRSLDRFRAPPTPEEQAKRRKRPLSPSQEHNLAQWGYPHVMDDFRFHMTLTGPANNVTGVLPVAVAHFAPVLPQPYVIDHLTLVGEDIDGMFHKITRLPLGA